MGGEGMLSSGAGEIVSGGRLRVRSPFAEFAPGEGITSGLSGEGRGSVDSDGGGSLAFLEPRSVLSFATSGESFSDIGEGGLPRCSEDFFLVGTGAGGGSTTITSSDCSGGSCGGGGEGNGEGGGGG